VGARRHGFGFGFLGSGRYGTDGEGTPVHPRRATARIARASERARVTSAGALFADTQLTLTSQSPPDARAELSPSFAAMPPPRNFKPPTLGGLGVTNLSMNGTLNLTRASVNTDLTASYNLDDEGIRLLSESRREFKLTETGFRASSREGGGGGARGHGSSGSSGGVQHADPSQHPRASGEGELHYNCSAKDLHVFGALGAGAGEFLLIFIWAIRYTNVMFYLQAGL
jgi:hypothetical protein